MIGSQVLAVGALALSAAMSVMAKQIPMTSHNSSTGGMTFSRIVVFGDSGVDNGNGTYLLSNKTWPSDPAYFHGRFSNGDTWPGQLADMMNVSVTNNYAYGGATTNNSVARGYSGYNSTLPVPDVIHQVTDYLKDVNNTADPRALYVVAGGSNDVFFGSEKSLDLFGIAEKGVATLKNEALRLVSRGARTIAFPTLTVLSKTPYGVHYSDIISNTGSQLFGRHFNEKLREAAKQVEQHAQVFVIDLHAASANATEHPERFQLKDVRDACLQGTTKPEVQKGVKRQLCADPDAYYFWDIYHPTRRGHQILAEAALRALQA